MEESKDVEKLWQMLAEGDSDLDSVEKKRQIIQGWLSRGDGCAVYENSELGNPNCGHRKFVSFGSKRAQIEEITPPQRLPDSHADINWRYMLIAYFRN